MTKTTLALLGLTLSAALLSAQQAPAPVTPVPTGRVIGRILDTTGTPVAGARVGIAVGGGPAVSSGIDGRYTLLNVPVGPVALAVRAIGYSPKTVSGIEVQAGAIVVQDIVLAAQTVQLSELTVAAAVERGSVAQALDEQRTAVGVVNSVTAEQIARSPDSDAGQAVQRVSGVTVQDGRYVFVRGLGERYTTTSLNNARIPSPEPDRKVVPLDLFPATLLEAVTTSKTFTPDQPGDFSGAQVNLRTREFDRGRMLAWSFSAGMNSAATFRDLQLAPTTGSEWTGVPDPVRDLPPPVAEAGNLSGVPAGQIPSLIGAFRNVWNAEQGTGLPNASMSVSLGGEDPVAGQLLGYLASLTYQTSTDVRRDEERALAVADVDGTRPQNAYRGISATNSVLWGGIVNLTTRIGSSSKLSFNNTYNRSADNGAVRAAGFNEEFARPFDITRLDFVSRSVRSNQLLGEHLIAGRHTLAWAVTSSGVTRDEPDRSDLAYEADIDSATGAAVPRQWFGGPRSGNRTFSSLAEQGWQGDLSWQWPVSQAVTVKVGGQVRTTDREADTRSYDIVNYAQSDADLARPAEQVFDDTTKLGLVANAFGGRYDAADRLVAGFAMAEVPLGRSVRLTGGARVERSDVTVDTRSPDGSLSSANPVTTDVLPALALTATVGRNQQLRLAASQTLSRPEYRELSNVCYFEILGGVTVCGNSTLQRARILNLDARWEWYPSGGEVLSVGLFAKRFDQPIERILVGTTGATTASFVNTEGAQNYGVEFELRKNLGTLLGSAFLPFSVTANVTLMRSEITIGADSITNLTNPDRPMVGQSPYVVNLGLGFTSPAGRLTATALYNVTGRRIVEVGTLPLPDAYEEARQVLDLAVRYDVSRAVGLKLDVRNLLDAPYEFTQGTVVRHRYTVGRSVSLGASWQP
jgi:outer membrane receptor for ferrienterochelin and colicin